MKPSEPNEPNETIRINPARFPRYLLWQFAGRIRSLSNESVGKIRHSAFNTSVAHVEKSLTRVYREITNIIIWKYCRIDTINKAANGENGANGAAHAQFHINIMIAAARTYSNKANNVRIVWPCKEDVTPFG